MRIIAFIALLFAAPLPAATSPNGLMVFTVGPTLTDAQGVVHAITAGRQITENNVVDKPTAHVTALVMVGGWVWQQNSAGNWYGHIKEVWTAGQAQAPALPALSLLTAPCPAAATCPTLTPTFTIPLPPNTSSFSVTFQCPGNVTPQIMAPVVAGGVVTISGAMCPPATGT